jgi:hypothetical protein
MLEVMRVVAGPLSSNDAKPVARFEIPAEFRDMETSPEDLVKRFRDETLDLFHSIKQVNRLAAQRRATIELLHFGRGLTFAEIGETVGLRGGSVHAAYACRGRRRKMVPKRD